MFRASLLALVVLLCVFGKLIADDDQQQRQTFVTGRRLQQELDKPVNIVRSRSTLRDVVRRLRELHGIALLVDRRIDPDQTLEVQLVQTSLREGLLLLATQLDAQFSTIGGTLFIGPSESNNRIRTLIALRTEEARNANSFRRVAELLQGTTLSWNDLAEPAQLIDDLSQTFRVETMDADLIPHDLWGRGSMADVNAVEALSLLLGQFELTFQWQPGGDVVRIIPAPEHVLIEQSHTSRTMSAAEAVTLVQQTWPHLRPTRQDRSLIVAATADEHDAIDELLNPQSEPSPLDSATQGPIENRRFTLTTTRAEAIAVLRTLELQGITVEYDPPTLKRAGIDLRQTLTLQMNRASADEFFTAICEPLGLNYEFAETTVRLTPK